MSIWKRVTFSTLAVCSTTSVSTGRKRWDTLDRRAAQFPVSRLSTVNSPVIAQRLARPDVQPADGRGDEAEPIEQKHDEDETPPELGQGSRHHSIVEGPLFDPPRSADRQTASRSSPR